MLDTVRENLLREAQQSPNLLSDLAGLEKYIAESYQSRSFIELLQNADDAGAKRFKIQRFDEHIFVANDGKIFNRPDFEGLCRSAFSSKLRGSSIGYRGIGFKSVVSFARKIHLFSGGLAATFSRERTELAVPQAQQVPLIRIPHPIDPIEAVTFEAGLQPLLDDGYNTVFVFSDAVASELETEFASFDPTSLLFLRNVRQLEFHTDIEQIYTLRRRKIGQQIQDARLVSPDGASQWSIIENQGVAIAFSRDGSGINYLDGREAVIHAFLPTEESSGLGVKLNGDISTDPSRRKVILDERTISAVDQLSPLIVGILKECLGSNSEFDDPVGAVLALVPTVDPGVLAFKQKSFQTELLKSIKNNADDLFKDLRYRPEWLNPTDFYEMAKNASVWTPNQRIDQTATATGYLKYLGAKEATLDEVAQALSSESPSLQGCTEITAYIIAKYFTRQIEKSQISYEWKIWPTDSGFLSLHKLVAEPHSLKREFVDMVREKAKDMNGLHRLLQELIGEQTTKVLLASTNQDEITGRTLKAVNGQSAITLDTEDGSAEFKSLASHEKLPKLGSLSPEVTHGMTIDVKRARPLSIKKWRSGEQQVLAILNLEGYTLQDVSRQNVGYDLEGKTPAGNNVFIEVKSVDYIGQPFILTNNEIAVARDKAEEYVVAVINQNNVEVNLILIPDPASCLELTRQCRQWVWECESYDFQPYTFILE